MREQTLTFQHPMHVDMLQISGFRFGVIRHALLVAVALHSNIDVG